MFKLPTFIFWYFSPILIIKWTCLNIRLQLWIPFFYFIFHIDFFLDFLFQSILYFFFLFILLWSHLVNHIVNTRYKFISMRIVQFRYYNRSPDWFLAFGLPAGRLFIIFFKIEHWWTAKIIAEFQCSHYTIFHIFDCVSHLWEENII